MFNVGDIVRQKQSLGRDNKVYYALIIRIEEKHSSLIATRITAQWLNWDDEIPIITLYEHEAKNWWIKVEE